MRNGNKMEAARAEDAAALLKMMESHPAAGKLELLYTRRPDPVWSILQESPTVSLGVLRGDTGEPRLMESCIERCVFLRGQACTLTYVGNLRKQEGAFRRTNWMQAVCEYEAPQHTAGFCSVLEDNRQAAALLLRHKHASLPAIQPLFLYDTLLFHPRAVIKKNGNQAVRLTEKNRPELMKFLKKEGSRYQMFPCINVLEKELFGLNITDFMGIFNNDRMVACGALWDQRPFRQYVVSGYHGSYRMAYHARALLEACGYLRLPPVGQTADVRIVTLLCAENGKTELMQKILSSLANEAQQQRCGILVYGIADNHHWYPFFRSLRALRFQSRIASVALPGNTDPLPDEASEASLEVGWL